MDALAAQRISNRGSAAGDGFAFSAHMERSLARSASWWGAVCSLLDGTLAAAHLRRRKRTAGCRTRTDPGTFGRTSDRSAVFRGSRQLAPVLSFLPAIDRQGQRV